MFIKSYCVFIKVFGCGVCIPERFYAANDSAAEDTR